MAIVRPGPFAAQGSGLGCGAAITRRRGLLLAPRPSGRHSICSKPTPNLMGPERAVHVRLAEQDGRIYLDLADECWRAVEIGRMVRHRLASGALSPSGGLVAASGPAARRLD